MNGVAAERTALSWQRTGLSAVAAAALLLRMHAGLSVPARATVAVAALVLLATAAVRRGQLRRAAPSEPGPLLLLTAVTATAAAGLSLLLDAAG